MKSCIKEWELKQEIYLWNELTKSVVNESQKIRSKVFWQNPEFLDKMRKYGCLGENESITVIDNGEIL